LTAHPVGKCNVGLLTIVIAIGTWEHQRRFQQHLSGCNVTPGGQISQVRPITAVAHYVAGRHRRGNGADDIQ